MFFEAARQLKAAAQDGRSFDLAQVKVIGLDDIKRTTGNRWDDVSGRIRANSMRFLQGCLGEDDLLIPAGDGFLVVYARAPGRDFESETATIQDALNGFYLGAEETRNLKTEITHERVNSRGLVAALSHDTKPAPNAINPCRHELSILPVWNAPREALTGYWVAPCWRAGKLLHPGYDSAWAESGLGAAEDYLALDLMILGRAIQEAERGLMTGKRCLLSFSAHASTLQYRSRRREYLAQLSTTPEKVRPYLVARIAEIESGTPAVTIEQWLAHMRPIVGRIAVQRHKADRAGFDCVGASEVSVVLPPGQDDEGAVDAYARAIPRWVAAAHRAGTQFRLDNVSAPALLDAAVAGGVDFLTSTRVWPTVNCAQGVKLFSLAQVQQAMTDAR